MFGVHELIGKHWRSVIRKRRFGLGPQPRLGLVSRRAAPDDADSAPLPPGANLGNDLPFALAAPRLVGRLHLFFLPPRAAHAPSPCANTRAKRDGVRGARGTCELRH